MIPRVYVEPRLQRIRLPGDSEDFVSINEVVMDRQSRKPVVKFDLAYGKFDARIETGPSYESLRAEAAEQSIAMMQVLPPEKADAIAHLVVKNLDWPGANDIYEILRKMLPDALKTEDEKAADLPKGYIMGPEGTPINEETKEPLPPPEPTPEQQLQQKQLEADGKEADGKMAKADAEIAKAGATKAEAEQAMALLQAGDGPESEKQANNQQLMEAFEARLKELMESHNDEIDDKMADQAVDILKRVRQSQSQEKPAESQE